MELMKLDVLRNQISKKRHIHDEGRTYKIYELGVCCDDI